MKSEFPASVAFTRLTHQLLHIRNSLDWPLVPSADKDAYPNAANVLLLATRSRKGFVEDRSVMPPASAEAWKAAVRQSPAGEWLTKHDEYRALQEALRRQAGRRGAPFSDADAPLSLMIATSMGLALWTAHKEAGTQPTVPLKRDWQRAIEAVDDLKRLESKGVSLTAAVKVNSYLGLPFDWLDQLRTAIEQASLAAPKAHNDPLLLERTSVKAFAHWIWLTFDGAVPPSLVVKFGRLIGYESALLERRHLPEWIGKFGTHSIY